MLRDMSNAIWLMQIICLRLMLMDIANVNQM